MEHTKSKLKPIMNLEAEAFKPYGTIIGFTDKVKDGWEVLINEPEAGWRVALYEINRKTTHILEHHPTSMETFEPVSGTTLLIVAEHESPQDYKVFLLDKPICLKKGIWHQVICLSDKSTMKITENYEVSCVFYEFPYEIQVGIL